VDSLALGEDSMALGCIYLVKYSQYFTCFIQGSITISLKSTGLAVDNTSYSSKLTLVIVQEEWNSVVKIYHKIFSGNEISNNVYCMKVPSIYSTHTTIFCPSASQA
jgi:hypothetical protein